VPDQPPEWPIILVKGTPSGFLSCLGCAALVLDDRAAVETHQTFHRVIDEAVNRVLNREERER